MSIIPYLFPEMDLGFNWLQFKAVISQGFLVSIVKPGRGCISVGVEAV